MSRRLVVVCALLFGSGFCALIYQTVWLRQFRLIFGASTAASGAVLAIFMGGLGIGGLLLGERAERSRNPLLMYGLLELGVAICAALTPVLFFVARSVYLAIGGSFVMGELLVTIIRLILSVIVLGLPAVLMGGTLPAAARSAEVAADDSRRAVASIYGLNTLGGVAGTLVSTFYLLEHFGNRLTLFAAALLNALVGLTALLISNRMRAPQGRSRTLRDEIEDEPAVTEHLPDVAAEPEAMMFPRLVYAAAAVTGFAFLLMEIVWYRMLTPLLGGTTFTFGLILATALLGIGGGSFVYSMGGARRASSGAFALCCAFEALFVAIPLALGDRLAVLAMLLRAVGSIGFHGYVLGWSTIAAIVTFPAAFVSGLQFPLLIALLGRGRERVARHVGRAYAWNTAGAIAGSLAGGFGLLPLLTAPGVWRLVVALLATLVFVVLIGGRAIGGRIALTSVTVSVVAVALLWSKGPTAFWRHTAIGAGRVDEFRKTPNQLRDFQSTRRRMTLWEADGVESSVSVSEEDGYAFVVNGKVDGHSRLDAGTQVMSGVLAGLLHPRPRRAVVVGLGTGTTAGWLGALSSMQHVDVVEIEPDIVHVAEMCSAVNRDVLHNPKVRVVPGDGREFLLTSTAKYDVISSEPSNPYRAGIASLFTSEFYRACLARLDRGGVFIQFLQAYEVDAPTIGTVYATIAGVFPYVETWQSQSGDLLLVGAREPLQYDAATIAARMSADPVVREGVWRVWWADDAAGVLAHFLCGDTTVRMVGARSRPNTDDRMRIEYAFARTVGTGDLFHAVELRDLARSRLDDLPFMPTGELRGDVERRRMSFGVPDNSLVDVPQAMPDDLHLRGGAQNAYVTADYGRSWTLWTAAGKVDAPLEVLTFAEALAERGDEGAMTYIDRLRGVAPVEAEILTARLRWREGRVGEAANLLQAGFLAYRQSAWPLPIVMTRAISLVREMSADPKAAPVLPQLFSALSEPFALHMFQEYRRSALLLLADRMAGGSQCSQEELALVQSYEPEVPWQRDYLSKRASCYAQWNEPRTEPAKRDWKEFRAAEPRRLADVLSSQSAQP